MKIGVDSFIWSEFFSEKDLWIIPKAKELGFSVVDIAIARPEQFPTEKVKETAQKTGIPLITSTTLNNSTNLISPDPEVRKHGVASMKLLIDINREIGSGLIGGMTYAAWGYLTGKPRTQQEWDWSTAAMREIARYAKDTSDVTITVECAQRFETHFLNVAADAVAYCKDVGFDNVKVHLDSFHMIREELSFEDAISACGKEYLGYMHLCESNRGIPGTGMVPWERLFAALKAIDYQGYAVIESFDTNFTELVGNCAIWRKFADSGEQLAVQGLANLNRILAEMKY